MGKLDFKNINVKKEEPKVAKKEKGTKDLFSKKIEPKEAFAPKENAPQDFGTPVYVEEPVYNEAPQRTYEPAPQRGYGSAQPTDARRYDERMYVAPQEDYGRTPVGYQAPQDDYNRGMVGYQAPREEYNRGTVMQHNTSQGFYSNPNGQLQKETSLAVLDNKEFVTVEMAGLNVERVKLPEMKDVKGIVSARINEMEDRTGISVLPFYMTNTMPTFTQLQDHKIIYIDGMPYSSSYKRIVNQREINAIIDEVTETVSVGEVAVISLLCERKLEGNVFKTCRVNEYELQTLLGALADFKAYIKMNKDNEGEMFLVAGDFYNRFR